MSDGSLSQDEIDALLQGVDDMGLDSGSGGAPGAPAVGGELTQQEQDVFLDIIKNQITTAANTLSTIISKKVEITNPVVEVKSAEDIRKELTGELVQINIDFTEGLSGKVLYVLKKSDAGIIADLMMGQDGSSPPEEFSDLYISAVGEAISQINGSGITEISNKLGKPIKVSPPQVELISDSSKLLLENGGQYVKVVSTLNVEGVISDSYLYEIYPVNVVKEIVASSSVESVSYTTPGSQSTMPTAAAPAMQQQAPQVNVRPVEFPSLNIPNLSPEQAANIQLLMDVPMQLTVELGRTRMLVKEILSLGEGSIIELDKLAGEPVDLLINNKLIAKGEVVVIDENFGVRVTDIVNPVERLASLKSG